VRFQDVTPDWTGWQSSAAQEPVPDEGAARRLRSLVRHAVDAARPKGRRPDEG
jgi:hypothetical protein